MLRPVQGGGGGQRSILYYRYTEGGQRSILPHCYVHRGEGTKVDITPLYYTYVAYIHFTIPMHCH